MQRRSHRIGRNNDPVLAVKIAALRAPAGEDAWALAGAGDWSCFPSFLPSCLPPSFLSFFLFSVAGKNYNLDPQETRALKTGLPVQVLQVPAAFNP